MTKFGIGVSVIVLTFILGIGAFVFGRPVPAPIIQIPQIPTDETSPTSPPVSVAEFDKNISLNVGQKVNLPDGLILELKKINDSRCKPDVQCFWQGELSAVLIVESSTSSASSTEIQLGTVLNKSVALGGYKFVLESATGKSVIVIVSKIGGML